MATWTLQVAAILPLTNNEFVLPWQFTSNKVLFVVNPITPKPNNHVHAGWIRQQIVIPGIPRVVTREFKRIPLGAIWLELDNVIPYELYFKCFTYLGVLEIEAYEFI